MLKAHFVLEILRFLSWLFSYVEKLLDKAKINFKIYGVTTYNHILPNISRIKVNQIMKFG